MRFHYTLPLLLVVGLASCSADSKEVSFSDPILALDRADAALASDNSATALAGYEYALANGDQKTQGDALMGLLSLHITKEDSAAAAKALDRLKADFSDRLDLKTLLRLTDLSVKSYAVDIGDSIVGLGVESFPELKNDFAKGASALERIRTQGPGVDLSDLGYAGD